VVGGGDGPTCARCGSSAGSVADGGESLIQTRYDDGTVGPWVCAGCRRGPPVRNECGALDLTLLQEARARLAAELFSADALSSPLARTLTVCEEAGELARAERLLVDDPGGERLDAADAVGDVVIALAGYCTARGLSLDACVGFAWRRVVARWSEGRRRGTPR